MLDRCACAVLSPHHLVLARFFVSFKTIYQKGIICVSGVVIGGAERRLPCPPVDHIASSEK